MLIVENSVYPTGALKSILSFTEQLSADFEFQFLMSSRSSAVSLVEELGYKVHRLPFLEVHKGFSVLFYLPRLLINAFKLQKIIFDENISVLHINDLYNQLGTVSKILNPKLFLIYHVRLLPNCYLGKFYFVFSKLIQFKADKIICVSQAVYQHFSQASNAVIISDGVVKIEMLPIKEYWINWPLCNVLYLANYVPGKGHAFALKAMQIALAEQPNLRMKMVGSTNNNEMQEKYLRSLKDLAIVLGIDAQVTFSGSTNEVEQEMKSADIVLNLSESESFSMVCLEALSYGVPLIASDCGGPAELFENNKSGILIPNRDSVSAANAIVDLIRNPKTAETIGINGKRFVRHKFDQDILLSKMRGIYNGI